MKTSHWPVLAVAFFAVASISSAGLSPKVEKIIAVLHDAKDSNAPLALLEDAHKKLEDYFSGVERVNGGQQFNSRSSHSKVEKRKLDALAALNKAIETAKAGGDVKPKVDATVALVRAMGALW